MTKSLITPEGQARLDDWLARGGDGHIGRGMAHAGSMNDVKLPVAPTDPREKMLDFMSMTGDFMVSRHKKALGDRLPGLLEGTTTWVITIQAPDGRDVNLQVTTPTAGADASRPAVYFMHGGGMCVFTPASPLYQCWTARLAQKGVSVVAVDFRSAVTAPFPGGLDDCVDGIRWLLGGQTEVPFSNVVLHGDSGGGHLAIATLVRLAEAEVDTARVRGCFAYAPFIAGPRAWATRDGKYPSLAENDGFLVGCDFLSLYGCVYTEDEDRDAPFAWPLLYSDAEVAAIPVPLTILVDELDPLRDEGIAFARRAAAHGKLEALQTLHGSPHVGALIEVMYGPGGGTRWGDHVAEQVAAYARSARV